MVLSIRLPKVGFPTAMNVKASVLGNLTSGLRLIWEKENFLRSWWHLEIAGVGNNDEDGDDDINLLILFFFLQISNKTNEIVSTLGFSFISKLDDKHMQICKTAQTKVHLALKLSHVKVQRPLKGESRRKKCLHLWKFSWFSDGVLRRLVVGTINLGKSQESPPIWEKSGQVRGNGDDGDLHATA